MPSLMSSLIRRWPMTLALVAVLAGLCVLTLKVVAPKYRTQASVVLVPPQSVDNPKGNRYLLLGGLTPARDVLMRSMDSAEVRSELLDDRPGADYELEPDFTTSAPIITITATAPTTNGSTAALDEVVDGFPVRLTALQDELKTATGARISILTIKKDETPTRVVKGQLRAVLAVGGLSAAAGVLLIGLIDGLLMRRRAKTPVTEGPGWASGYRARARAAGRAGAQGGANGRHSGGGAGEGRRRASDERDAS